MATILSVENDDGTVGRCDATCYLAKGKTCTCICGGLNHGVGEEQALANGEDIDAEELDVKAFETSRQRHSGTCTVVNHCTAKE